MKTRKQRVRLMLLVLGMMGVTGCMSKEEADRQALEKFKEKYGVDCQVVYNEVIDDSVENRDEIHVYVENWMEEGESAVIYSWVEKGKAVSRDNLFGYIIREDYENSVKELLKQQFPEGKAYAEFVSNSFPDTLTQDSTLEDAYDAGERMLTYLNVLVKENTGDLKNKGEEFCQELAAAKLYGGVKLYVLSEEAYEKADRGSYKDILKAEGYQPDGATILEVYHGKSYGK